MQRNKTITVFQGRVPNAAAGRHLQLHTCPLHCQPIDHRQLCRGEIKSKIKSKRQKSKSKSRNKIKMKKQNQNLFIVNQSITSNSLEVRSRPRPTRYTTPTSHFLKNFLKNNVQTIPIISNYHLCLVQNGTTFPQGATKPLSELCHPLQ